MNEPRFCLCGCGREVKNKYCVGHAQRAPEARKKRSAIATRVNTGRVLSVETKEKIASSLRGFQHTEKTKEKMRVSRKQRVGELSPRWNGGSSGYGMFWNRQSAAAKQRDNYTCQGSDCAGTCSVLDVHHIDRNKRNNNLDNLICLCRSCHTKLHPKGFIKNRGEAK